MVKDHEQVDLEASKSRWSCLLRAPLPEF